MSSVNRRQAQARWTQPILYDGLTLALAVEDTRFLIETPVGLTADPRSPSPDFVGALSSEDGMGPISNRRALSYCRCPAYRGQCRHIWGRRDQALTFKPRAGPRM